LGVTPTELGPDPPPPPLEEPLQADSTSVAAQASTTRG
jgi:hypothetical protein